MNKIVAVAELDDPLTSRNHYDVLTFHDYVVFPAARLVEKAGKPIELGARAFDLLVFLLRRRGEVVDKNEILAAVWPTTTVTEGNLRFQISALRRALHEGVAPIKKLSGRGYLLAAEHPDRADT